MAKLGLRMVLESAETRSYFAAWQLAVDQIRVDVIRLQLKASRELRMAKLKKDRALALEAKVLLVLVRRHDGVLDRIPPDSPLARGILSYSHTESAALLILAAATRISAVGMGFNTRQDVKQARREAAALAVIRRYWRDYMIRRKLEVSGGVPPEPTRPAAHRPCQARPHPLPPSNPIQPDGAQIRTHPIPSNSIQFHPIATQRNPAQPHPTTTARPNPIPTQPHPARPHSTTTAHACASSPQAHGSAVARKASSSSCQRGWSSCGIGCGSPRASGCGISGRIRGSRPC